MLAAALIGLGVSAGSAQAITVTSTANAGAGTLRSAINQANANANLSVIDFNLPAVGGNTITPANNLPVITQPVEIRGAGVVVDAVNTAWGLALNTGASSIQGITINDSSGVSAAVGIQVAGNGNSLAGIQIGTDAAGAAFGMWNLSTGVLINGNQNVVKDSLISESNGDGLAVNGNQNIVVGNLFGLATGGLGNSNSGVVVTGNENQIGGMNAGDGNVSGENNDHGVEIAGNLNRVEGNYVGLDATGANGLGNVNDGIHLTGNQNLVRGNVSSDNDAGVFVDGTSNTIMANTLGTDVGRAVEIGNWDGVQIAGGFTNLVADNFTAGNQDSGVKIEAGQNHRVEANDLGTAALPNDDGVLVQSSFNVVTGNTATGNRDAGVKLDSGAAGPPALGNVVEDNDLDGNEQGVVIEDSHRNAVTDNTITGNLDEGVLIEAFDRPNADGNWLTGNTIDGNGLSGVRIEDGAENSVGLVDREVNVITDNGEDGVTVESGEDNAVVNNSIYRNADLGIDLEADGVTANDGLLDLDTGANGLQNHPVIDSHTLVLLGVFPDLVAKHSIAWTLRTEANTDYRLEFYLNDQCAGGHDAKELLATEQVTTDGAGLAQGAVLVDPVDEKVTVSATETDAGGNVAGPTSELSTCG
jgi:parallel beta-helix repeat protein